MKGVIFDFGNVLGNFDKLRACRRLACSTTRYDAKAILEIISTRLEKRLESGGMSETAFANELLHHIGSDLTVPDVMRIWGNIFSENPPISHHVGRLIAKGVRVGVLSNTNGIHWPYICDLPVMQTLMRHHAPITLSYREKALKPEARLFSIALDRIGTRAAQTLYIDDMEPYVHAARGTGLKAAQYDCRHDKPEKLTRIMRDHDLA